MFVYYCFFFKYSVSFSFIRLSYYFIHCLFSYWFCCSLLPLLLFVLFVDLFLSFLLFVIVFAFLSPKLMSLDSPSWMLAFSVIRSWVHRVYFVPHKPMLHRFHLYKEILLTASFIYFPRFTSFSRYFLFHFNSSTHQYLDLRFTIK